MKGVDSMLAWHVDRPGQMAGGPLRARRDPLPEPAAGELLLKVLVCCEVRRTDLHVTEGDLPVHRPGVTPGHEVVGEVVETRSDRFAVGDRAGVAWLRGTCGTCRYCLRGAENLCPDSRYTGWDEHGGYAEYTVVPADHAHNLPGGYSDAEPAPLLCAGTIGYRAPRCPRVDGSASTGSAAARTAARVALARGAVVHVMTRSARAREPALEPGVASAAGAADPPPEPLDSAVPVRPAR